ncbi:ankyrin repeat domain-containing protein 31 isoform X2 [Anomaloglossus baeobatrachus]|uniref:ankyrin repeat domain-containing protein 31 isoform X2 n=1 Tax=Anomaloglossus baeobatrachus TaxID=238106 RepID=UPI003F50A295
MSTGEFRITRLDKFINMKEGDSSRTNKTPMYSDYDSDETMVDDSIPGSDEEQDETYLKRIFINGNLSPTSASGLCPTKKNVGKMSPEIHVISNFLPAASMETALKQVSHTMLEEEASQSLLRNLERLPPYNDSGPSLPSKDLTGLCEDSQPLFHSFELEMQNNNSDGFQDSSLLSAITAIDVSYPDIEMVPLDNIETVCIPEKDQNVSDTSKDEGANIACEEPGSFIDDMSIDKLLKITGEMDSFTQLTEIIDDLSFLEMSEDGSGELTETLLAAINCMQDPQSLQSGKEGCSVEEDYPDTQGNTDFSNDNIQIPGPDESVKHKREFIQKIDKEILEETIANEESTSISPSMLNSLGCIPSDISQLFNVEEQLYTQNSLPVFDENSTCIKGQNVSWNEASCSQTCPSLLEKVKPTMEVSKIATCNKAATQGSTNEEQNVIEATGPQVLELTVKDCVLLMSQNNTNFEMDQQHKELSKSPKNKEAQDHLSVNTRWDTSRRDFFERTCRVSDSEKLLESTESTELLHSGSKNSTVKRGTKRKSKLSQPHEHTKELKSTESTKTTEIILRKSFRRRIFKNFDSCCAREKGTERVNRIDSRQETYDCTSPFLVVNNQLNKTAVQLCRSSKSFRNIHKRNFIGETLLHKACRKGDIELVNSLIEAGININEKDNAGWTALHEASCNGNSEIIMALIQAGAYVNSKGLDGIIPLHDAVYCNHFKVAEILMKFGANPYIEDSNMKNAFDKCCSDKMAEILTSHYGTRDTPNGYVSPNKKDPQHKNTTNLPSDTDVCRAEGTCSEEILDTLHIIENNQKKLLSTELEALEDAEKCVEELNEIQNVLNNIVNLQKIERDTLAKKYRASADSFRQGILRDKIAKLASNQKTLLQVVRNQKEVTLKITAHQHSKKSDANNGETSSTLHYCHASPERNQISALCAVNEWLEANIANGSTMTTKIPAVDREPDAENSQSLSTISKCISSSEISRAAEVPTAVMISERTGQHNADLTPTQKPGGLENGPLSFDSCSIILNDHLDARAQGSESQISFPVSMALDIARKNNISTEKNIHEISEERHLAADTDQQLQRFNYYEIQQASHEIPAMYDASEYWKLQHKATGPTSNVLSQKVYENIDSQLVSEKQKTCIETEKKNRKFPFKKLMKLGKLKPGVDVLSFQIQVTYMGKKLSSFVVQEDFPPKTVEESDPDGNIAALPHLQTPGHTLLQVKEILLIDKSELFPSHVMDKYWEEFMNSNHQDL